MKYLYIDVILRTSIFPCVFGAAVAQIAGVAIYSPESAYALAIAILGILIVQGLIEHGLDILKDRGGYSAFRYKPSQQEQERIRRYIKLGYLLVGLLIILIVILWRPWLILMAVMAIRSAKLYVQTHNEWYSVFGFMLSFSSGYFAMTNAPTTQWLLGAMATGFIMKSSQVMYRLDDYLEGEFNDVKQIIQYYRNIFRNSLHMVPLLFFGILIMPEIKINYKFWPIWAVGILIFSLQVIRLTDKVRQEVNLLPLIASIIAVEILSGNASWDYLLGVSIALACFHRFWRNRHAMCNILYCPLNPIPKVKIPK